MIEGDGGSVLPPLFDHDLISGFTYIDGHVYLTLAWTRGAILPDGVVSADGVCGTGDGAGFVCCGVTVFSYSTVINSDFLLDGLRLGLPVFPETVCS